VLTFVTRKENLRRAKTLDLRLMNQLNPNEPIKSNNLTLKDSMLTTLGIFSSSFQQFFSVGFFNSSLEEQRCTPSDTVGELIPSEIE
jgi:hypothetical protein